MKQCPDIAYSAISKPCAIQFQRLDLVVLSYRNFKNSSLGGSNWMISQILQIPLLHQIGKKGYTEVDKE